MRAADAPAQLVDLSQTQSVRAVHEHGIHGGDVQPRFDDERRDQHVGATLQEIQHHALQLHVAHLAVRHAVAELRDDALQVIRDPVDRFHAVVDEEGLPAAIRLPEQGVADHVLAHLHDLGLDGIPPTGRRLHDGHVARAEKAHVERARDRRRGQREDVHVLDQRADPLLLRHPEALLLVHDHEAQVLELHVLREKPVRADHDVQIAVPHLLHDLLLLLGRPEPAQHVDPHGKIREALREGHQVLLREHGRGHEHRDLGALLHRLERRADRHLGLAVAHVAADQPVHGARGFHVTLHFLHRAELVGRLLVGEGGFQLALPRRVGAERPAAARLPDGVAPEQLLGHLLNRLPRFRLGPQPLGSAQAGDERRAAFLGGVALHHAQLIDRNEEPVGAGVVDLDALGVLAVERDPLESAVDADPMVQVHHVLARLERHEIADRGARGRHAASAPAAVAREDLVIGEDGEARGREHESRREGADVHRDHAFAQDLFQPLRLAFVVADDDALVLKIL